MTHKGSGLEAAVVASQGRAVRLTQVRGEAVRTRHGVIQKRGPVDFAGALVPSGRAIVFDAKVCGEKHRLVTSADHLPPHQRLQIILFGEAGAVAGVLAESTHLRRYFWLRWQALKDGAVSYRWDHPEMVDVGPATHRIDWARVVAAADRVAQVTVSTTNPI